MGLFLSLTMFIVSGISNLIKRTYKRLMLSLSHKNH